MSKELEKQIAEIENWIFGAIFFDKQKAWDKLSLLPEDFFLKQNREVMQVMREAEMKSLEPWEIPTLVSLKDEAWVANAIKAHIDTDVPAYSGSMQALQEKHRQLATKLKVLKVIDESKENLDELVSRLSEISFEKFDDSEKDVFAELYNEIELLKEGKGSIGIKTNLEMLDEFLMGLRAGQLVVIGARPSMGKSAFSLNLALRFMEQRVPVYIQALEETAKDIYRRAVANLADVSLSRLSSGKILEHEWSKIASVASIIKKEFFTIDDDSGLSSSAIMARVMKAHRKGKVGVLIVDHIQEIQEGGKFQNRHLEISTALSNLRILAKKLQIPVIVLSQINRGVEQRSQKEPLMSDLKESGDIEAKADVVMLLHREKYYNENLEDDFLKVIIAKNRNGKRGSVMFEFNGDKMRIS